MRLLYGNDFSLRIEKQEETFSATLIIPRIEDILYIKGMNEYVQIHLRGRKPLMVHITLKQMKERLPVYFLQVHRSYIVNMRQVKEIERLRIVMDEDTRIAVGANYKKVFQDYLSAHSLEKSIQTRIDGESAP